MPDDSSVKLHQWFIEEREYRCQEERRGRRHAFAHLVSSKTALVILDMVPFFLAQSAYIRGIVPNLNRLAEALRAAGGTVAWVLPRTNPQPSRRALEFFGAESAEAYSQSGGTGPLSSRFSPCLQPQEQDPIVEKTYACAFFSGSSELPSVLEQRGIDTVLITGTVTNVCCESSARDACTLGYRVILVADTNAARRDQDHNATLYNIYRTFGDVRPTDEVLEMIRAFQRQGEPSGSERNHNTTV